MNVNGHFSFYPVGQGCFYGGAIYYKSSKFTFVYDCGTDSSQVFLNQAIIEFKKKHNKIDLLVISHFHEDHVGGVKELLTGIRCDRVIIPYYDPLIRLILLARHPFDDDYAAFLRSPINYISVNFNVGEIIVLHGGNEGDRAITPNIKSDAPMPNEDGNLDLQILHNTSNTEMLQAKVMASENIKKADLVRSLSIPTTFVLSEIWEFVFYTKDFNNPNGIADFKSAIDDLLSKNPGYTIESLFDHSIFPIVAKLYSKHIVNDINFTSLCLYHGPVQRCRSIHLNGLNIVRYSGFMKNNQSGTILTGDSFLKVPLDFDSFYKYYSSVYIDQCYFFQIPHHGSANNWNMLPNGLMAIPLYIVNYGFKRKKHPSKLVLDNINTMSIHKTLLHNHQYAQINYSIKALP